MRKKNIISIISTIMLVGCGSRPTNINIALPKNNKVVYFNSDITPEFSKKAIQLSKDLLNEDNNEVLSPVGFSLCMAGYLLSSENGEENLNRIGLNSISDVKNIMNSLNWTLDYKKGFDVEKSQITTLILNQIIDDSDTLSFNKKRQDEISKAYISTLKSKSNNAKSDVSYAIKQAVGKDLALPNYSVNSPSCATISALYLKDSCRQLSEITYKFKGKEQTKNVAGTSSYKRGCKYYEDEIYSVFQIDINKTDLMFVLPKENHTLSEIDILSAYSDYINSNMICNLKYKVPFFKIENKEDINFTSVSSAVEKDTIPYFELVNNFNSDGTHCCLQTNKFDFNKNGVEGESVTAEIFSTSSGPSEEKIEEKEIIVDRPFYAISSFSNLPLFMMKMVDIN